VSLKICRVSFRDPDGVRHQVEVNAESVYEAAVLALKAFKKSEWIDSIGTGTRIDIEVSEPPVQHFLMYGQLTQWLDGGAKSPAEMAKKRKLKEMLAS
jgi:hypothetical protein